MSSNTLSLNRFAEVLGLKKTSTSKTKEKVKTKKGLTKERKEQKRLTKEKKEKKGLTKGKKGLTKGKKGLTKGKKGLTKGKKGLTKGKKGLTKGKKEKKGLTKEKKTKKQSRTLIIQNPLCDTCIKIKKDKINPATLLSMNDEDWRNAPNHIPILGKKQDTATQEVNINLGSKYANRLLYYFSAKSIETPGKKIYPNVYKNSTNNGLLKLDNEGKGVVYVYCPSTYCDKVPKTISKNSNVMTQYINHIHMIVSDKNMSRWEDNMFTQNVLCKINKEDYLRRVRLGVSVVINALDKEYNIPGTDGNILYKDAQKMKPDQLRKLVMYIAISKSIKHKKLINLKNVHNMPLIVYCHNPKCDAAKLLTEELYNAGFNEILYYNGGFLGYHNRL